MRRLGRGKLFYLGGDTAKHLTCYTSSYLPDYNSSREPTVLCGAIEEENGGFSSDGRRANSMSAHQKFDSSPFVAIFVGGKCERGRGIGGATLQGRRRSCRTCPRHILAQM